MRKLRTPLQYESMLAELNEIRPLQVSDLVKQSICMPVCNRHAESISKASDGVFVKGTQHGHILTKNSPNPTEYELKQYDLVGNTEIIEVVFSQKVSKVICNAISLSFVMDLSWCVPVTHEEIQDFNVMGIHQVNFVGTILYMFVDVPPFGQAIFDLYGFY